MSVALSTPSVLPPGTTGALPQTSDQTLFRRYSRGDVCARESIVDRYMPLARRLAARYRNSGEAREDLEQVAYLGLLKTIDRYEPGAGSFVGYAVPSIRGELKRHFRDKGWGTHVARPVQERWLRVNQATEALTSSLGRSPTPRQIAERTGFTLEEVLEAMEAGDAYSPRALDAPLVADDDGSRTLGESLGHEDPGFAHVEIGAAVGPAFALLPERQKRIVHMRLVEDMTQSQIAEKMNISQMHVSRLLRRSLNELQAAAA